MQELTTTTTTTTNTTAKSATKKPVKTLADGAFIMNTCTRCGHKWIQRKKGGMSVKCPKCKSKYWSRQYERPWSVPRIKEWYAEKRAKEKEAKEENQKS